MEAFGVVADLAAGRYEEARAAVARLDRSASKEGYDRFILNWVGWMCGLATREAVEARRWVEVQHDFLDRCGVVETWLSSFSRAMCDVIEGGDVRTTLRRTLILADREGYQAHADSVLVLAFAEICGGRFDLAAELVGTAMQARFNATAHYVLYSVVIDPALRRHLDPDVLAAARARGHVRQAAEALAEYGVD